jgi:hypothetical protein
VGYGVVRQSVGPWLHELSSLKKRAPATMGVNIPVTIAESVADFPRPHTSG